MSSAEPRAADLPDADEPASDGDSLSLWSSTALAARPHLDSDTSADVCVIGAGIAGLSVAYLLGREGRSVVVIDDKAPGDGQTMRTTAHLSAALDDGFRHLANVHGPHGLQLAVASHAAAIDRIEAICTAESIDCDFRRVDEYLFNPVGAPHEDLEAECAAAQQAGLDAELVPGPLDFEVGACVRFRNQAQFHPGKYLAGLVRAIERDGGRIYSATHASRVIGGAKGRVETSRGFSVSAPAIVVATNSPVNNTVIPHPLQAAYRSYAIAASVTKFSVPVALYSDTEDPYHYVRVQPGDDRDILIVGGEDHRTGQDADPARHWDALASWARERFPTMGAIEASWSGQILEPADGLAFIGRNPLDRAGVYIATGDSGHGITHGTIAGILLTDLIQHRDNPWTALYAPSRMTLRSVGELVRENLNTAAQYALWLAPGEDSDAIPRGEGALVRRGLHLVATYVDYAGMHHECSAVCPHLGGIVRWNRAERTWDCPCHGSRFDPHGRVVEGPAIEDLSPLARK